MATIHTIQAIILGIRSGVMVIIIIHGTTLTIIPTIIIILTGITTIPLDISTEPIPH